MIIRYLELNLNSNIIEIACLINEFDVTDRILLQIKITNVQDFSGIVYIYI